MDTSTIFVQAYFYTLSALLQGFAALITLTAMFAIFKLQTIHNKIVEARERSINALTINYPKSHPLYIEIANLSLNNLVVRAEDRIKKLEDQIKIIEKEIVDFNLTQMSIDIKKGNLREKQQELNLISEQLQTLKRSIENERCVISSLWAPFITNLIVVAASSILLPLRAYFNNQAIFWMWAISLIAVLALFLSAQYIIKILRIET